MLHSCILLTQLAAYSKDFLLPKSILKNTCGGNNNNNNSNTNKKQTINFRWIPKIGRKIKKEIQRFWFRVAFQTDPSLKNILCTSKYKLIANSYPGVYELKSSCGSVYNGKTRKKIISRLIQHFNQWGGNITKRQLSSTTTQNNDDEILLKTECPLYNQSN